MKRTSNRNHLADIISLRHSRAQEDAAKVNVVRDITSRKGGERDAEVSLQYLNCHGGLLLPDARQLFEALAELRGGRPVTPYPFCLTAILSHDDPGSLADPARDLIHEAVKLRGCWNAAATSPGSAATRLTSR